MSRLESLSNEIFENIVSQLDFESICNLRCCNHELSHKTVQKTFKSFFQSQHVVLSLQGLESFNEKLSGFLSKCVRDLTIVGLIYDHKTATLHRSRSDVIRRAFAASSTPLPPGMSDANEWGTQLLIMELLRQRDKWISIQKEGIPLRLLREAFDRIGSQQRCLRTLTLEIQVVQSPGQPSKRLRDAWSPTWTGTEESMQAAAAEAFTLTMRSLRDSKLGSVQALDIYSSSRSCSIPVDVLTEIFGNHDTPPPAPLADVRKLFIYFDLRAPVRPIPQDNNHSKSSPAYRFGLTDVLRYCSNVEELHLERSEHASVKLLPRSDELFRCRVLHQHISHLTENVLLPHLHTLHLHRLRLDDSHLAAAFLAFRQTLTHVELVAVFIDGSLRSALAPLTNGTCHRLEFLAIEALYENVQFVMIQGGQDERQVSMLARENGILRALDNEMRFRFVRSGDGIRRPLVYQVFRIPLLPTAFDPRRGYVSRNV